MSDHDRTVWELRGDDLAHLLEYLDGGRDVHTLRVRVDGGVSFKTNEDTWTVPLGVAAHTWRNVGGRLTCTRCNLWPWDRGAADAAGCSAVYEHDTAAE